MLDPYLEKNYILVKLPENLKQIRKIIEDNAKMYHLEVLDFDNKYNAGPNLKGAFLFIDEDINTALLAGNLTKYIQKVFILSDNEIAMTSSSYEICNVGYKRIEEKIHDYFDKIEDNPIDITIERVNGGFTYATAGNIRINPYPGLFISVDHPDGAGSSTLCKSIVKFLEDSNIECFATEEPTNELFGGAIRTALRGRLELFPDAMQLLYTIDRIEHTRLINEALKAGKVVVESRFTLSTLAFGYKDIPLGFLLAANARVYWPDINLLIQNVQPETSIERINKRLEKTEKFDNVSKLSKVNEGLRVLNKLFNGITYDIDGTKDIDNVAKQAINTIKRHEKFKSLQKE